MARTAVLLVAHGSRDRAYVDAAHAFFAAWQRQAEKRFPDCDFELCFLELAEPLFAEALAAAAESSGRLVVLALFLHPGRHLLADIPEMIATCEGRFPGCTMTLLSPLLDPESMAGLLTERLGADAALDGIMVLSHGKSVVGEPGGMLGLSIALHRFSGMPAGVSPLADGFDGLKGGIETLAAGGCRKVAVLQHLLFPTARAAAILDAAEQAGAGREGFGVAIMPPLGVDSLLFDSLTSALEKELC